MAVVTKEEAKELAKRALKYQKQGHEYTVIILGDKGFNHKIFNVLPEGVGFTHPVMKGYKRKYQGNLVCLTYSELRSLNRKTQTINGLANVIYERVNEEIEQIIFKQLEEVAKDSIEQIQVFFRGRG